MAQHPVAAALRQRCRPEGNWVLSRPARWRLTAKAIVVYLLRRERTGADKSVAHNLDNLDAFDGSVSVAVTDGGSYWGPEGTHHWWEELRVARGWRSWWYALMQDGSP